MFTWHGDNVISYTFNYCQNSNFTGTVYNPGVGTNETIGFTKTSVPNGTWYIRVRAETPVVTTWSSTVQVNLAY